MPLVISSGSVAATVVEVVLVVVMLSVSGGASRSMASRHSPVAMNEGAARSGRRGGGVRGGRRAPAGRGGRRGGSPGHDRLELDPESRQVLVGSDGDVVRVRLVGGYKGWRPLPGGGPAPTSTSPS